MKIQSNKESFSTSPERVFNALLNFTRQELPSNIPQIKDWRITEDGCSFNINDMVTCYFHLVGQMPFTKVTYRIDTDKKFSAHADFLIEDSGSGCTLQIVAEADIPIFLQPMLKGTIEQAINKALSRLKEMIERS